MKNDLYTKYGPATRAIHAGSEPDQQTGAVTVPIYQTSTFAQNTPGIEREYVYARTDNPTRTAYQQALASMEGAAYGLAFASGMAAIDTLMKMVRPGERVLAGDDLYGGTYRLFATVYQPMGIAFTFADLSGDINIEDLIDERTRYIWLETPTNPLLKVADIARIAKVAKAHGAATVVDNTFMSPALQQPLALGADIVVHSTTKYIGGHSDTVGGAIITDQEDWYGRLKTMQNSVGAVPGPFDCFLAHRGLKTLPLRMERHSTNALAVARWLSDHPRVEKVIYPFLESHPNYDLARKQQTGGGGMVSCYLRGGKEEALKAVCRTRLFTLAESLGGVESLIEHPAEMTHSSVPAKIRIEKGLTDDLIRLSVGIEDIGDLIGDLEEALS